MTYEDVTKRYHEYLERDEEHNCDEESNQEFVLCEVCQSARQAYDWLTHNAINIVELLEQEHAIRKQLTFRVIQDVAPETRTPELQEVVMDSVHLGGGHAH